VSGKANPNYNLPSTKPLEDMSGPTKYLLVSLPTSISQSSDKEEAFATLQNTVSTDNGTVLPFKIPEFKIGTLDALVQQADDLAKLEGACQAIVGKVGDSLGKLLEGDEDKIAQQKTVNDSMCWLPLRLHISDSH
jgi:V-type H+-transporting ATPase subunit C